MPVNTPTYVDGTVGSRVLRLVTAWRRDGNITSSYLFAYLPAVLTFLTALALRVALLGLFRIEDIMISRR
jgi:hypothetical protein